MKKFWMVKWANPPMDEMADVMAAVRGKDRPTHVEHPTLEGAMVEAGRLARVFPDRTFVVLESIKVVKATIETEAQEWIGDGLFRDHRDYARDVERRAEVAALANRTGPKDEE